MSDTIMIPIPAPPDGWVFDTIRGAKNGEQYFRNGRWIYNHSTETALTYPVAIPIPLKWTPPPEWVALFGRCWVTRNAQMETWIHKSRPEYNCGYWTGGARSFVSLFVRPELLPPCDIPVEQCCWEIGGEK